MSARQNISSVIGFRLPVLVTSRDNWQIVFYAYDPSIDKLRRKRIRLNSVKPAAARRKYATALMARISQRLVEGWNPWTMPDLGEELPLVHDMFEAYRTYVAKMYRDGIYREATLRRYTLHSTMLEDWLLSRTPPVKYVYQITREVLSRYLDEVFVRQDNSASTRDNYLTTVKLVCNWAVQRDIMKMNPSEGLHALSRRLKKKGRTVISATDMDRIGAHLAATNRHFLLACYLLYYCFIRPREMSLLRLRNISVKRQTILIPDDVSKNKRDGTVTLPTKVLRLMADLKIFERPDSDFIFSRDFMPGSEYVSEKQFRDYWVRHVRRELGLPASYKFYSLKDTGITNMLRHYDTLSVRDQARHSSVLMTDIYTPHDIQQANDLIKDYSDSF